MKKILQQLLLCMVLIPLLLGTGYLVQLRLLQTWTGPARPAVGPSSSAATPAPEETDEPQETPEIPAPQSYVLSAIGDCTLQSGPNFLKSPYGYAAKMGEDYAYPFSNTVRYFENDDFTLANLECNFSDSSLKPSYMAQLEGFYFLSPAAWAQILSNGGVDFVTTANNHFHDFGDQGVEDTCAALEDCGILYGLDGQAQIVSTDSGLVLGIYCASNGLTPKKEDAVAAIGQLKEDGAEYIICMFHWGKELYYSPSESAQETARACIDAGASLVYGSHPHCLQPVEEYNGGIILYSMGNWSFGGSTMPTDPDTAIVRITVLRDPDGKISNSGFEIIPCGVSSQPYKKNTNYNDYRPTPYEEGSSEYGRVLSKLDGSYTPDREGADYSNYHNSWG